MARPSQRTSPLRASFRALLSAFVVFHLLWVSPLFAQGSADSARLESIRQQMEAGQGLFIAQKFKEAAAAFEAGYQAYPYSAFLFNAGVCYQKLGEAEAALGAFNKYLEKDPSAPDADAVRERVAKIQEAVNAAKVPEGAGTPQEPPKVDLPDAKNQGMKSLVIIETEPAGAPVRVFLRTDEHAPDYKVGAKNTAWKIVAEKTSPVSLTLDVGRYYILVEKFADFNAAETKLDVSPGHVHHFKANLSQGEFTGLLEVTSNVVGAKIYLDDKGDRKVIWGESPHGALISPGKHTVLVEAPGYEPATFETELGSGDKKVLEVELTRVGFGVLRLDADIGEVTLSVDQKPMGVWRQGQSALEVELPAGLHDVLVSARGYKDLRQSVTIPRGQVLPMRARMIENFPRGAAWTQAIIAAGFLGASTYFGVKSNQLNNDLAADREAGYLHDADPRLKQGFWYSVGADGGFAVGGILALLATYNFIRDPYPDPQLQVGKKKEFTTMRRGGTLSVTPEAAGPAPVTSRHLSSEFARSSSVGGLQ